MIKNNKKTLKTMVFSLGLAVLLLTANNLNAQDDSSRGLFGLGPKMFDDNNGGFFRKGIDRDVEGGIQNDSFGTPLGSGIAILMGAGLVYVALKKKEDQQ